MDIVKAHQEALANLYTDIGSTLVLCQMAEKQLKSINTLKINEDEKVEFDRIFSATSDKRMLGLLLKTLTTKFALSKEFADRLKDFIQRRNKLVHDLDSEIIASQTEWEELARTHVFVSELRLTAKAIIDTLCSIEMSIAANYKSPFHKQEIESMFVLNEPDGNQYIEGLRKLVESGALKGIYEQALKNEVAIKIAELNEELNHPFRSFLKKYFG